MTFQLTEREIIERVQEYLTKAFSYYALNMKLNSLGYYYKARTYQDALYELGYSSDDIPAEIIKLLGNYEKLLLSFKIIEVDK